MAGFQDHFSGHADRYAAARPTYPEPLFAWMAATCSRRADAWDVGCGNGQAAVRLAAYFDRVLATDPSAAQIDHAIAHPGVEYRVEPAERCSAPDGSFDLVSVAQALHWFDQAAFFAEVRRVARPGAVIVVWGYDLLHVDPGIDAVITAFHALVQPHWPPERAWVATHYGTLAFPFAPIELPRFSMSHEWPLPRLVDYLETWSALQRYRRATGVDPMPRLAEELADVWGDPSALRRIEWPLFGRAGSVLP